MLAKVRTRKGYMSIWRIADGCDAAPFGWIKPRGTSVLRNCEEKGSGTPHLHMSFG